MPSRLVPTALERQALHDGLRAYIRNSCRRTGEKTLDAETIPPPLVVKIFDNLWERLEESDGQHVGITADALAFEVGFSVESGANSIYAGLRRLRKYVDSYFCDRTRVSNSQWILRFRLGDVCPYFERNMEPLLQQFWQDHLRAPTTTKILYPEPMCFSDGKTVFRSPSANRLEDRHNAFGYLGRDVEEFTPHYSYVPSGAVKAVARIVQTMGKLGCSTDFEPFSPHDVVPAEPNLIVLGTCSSMNAVDTLEDVLPIRTGHSSITIKGIESPDTDSSKFGTLTRRWHRSRKRIVTVISAHHGAVVQAIAECVCDVTYLEDFFQFLNERTNLATYFQVAFNVKLEEDGDRIQIGRVKPIEAFDITDELTH